MKGKKGSYQDILYLGVTVVFLGMLILLGFTLMSKFNDKFQADTNIDSYGKNASLDLTNKYTGIIDNMMMVLVIGLGLVAVVLASMVRVSPIFLVFFILVLFILIILCGVFSNIYQGMAENPTMTAYADQLTFTSLILEYLPFIVGVFGIIIMIVLYKVGQSE